MPDIESASRSAVSTLLFFSQLGLILLEDRPNSPNFLPRETSGCHSTEPTPPSVDQPAEQIRSSRHLKEPDSQTLPADNLPLTPCKSCVPINSTAQDWCVLRPPGTDCSPVLPWNNNFSRQRILYWYQCSQGVAICCSPWQDNDCCNESQAEPACSGGGATYRCSDLNCP